MSPTEPSSAPPSSVVAFVPDLMDRSKLATAFGARLRFVRRPDDLAAGAELPQLALVDLSRAGVLEAIGPLVAAGVRVVAFGPHVDDERLGSARAAGAEVMARSAFFRRIGDLADEQAR